MNVIVLWYAQKAPEWTLDRETHSINRVDPASILAPYLSLFRDAYYGSPPVCQQKAGGYNLH